ncbi:MULTISPECIES: SDR family oxidoreductase [unclassified Nesterenkonia]|uniref:SDR family oxidoreductase n=1 Tax=unclassified Nesterenkonia TaxID=2629769 RepID=UPI001F4C8E87|nr:MULTISPECIES: SDR family oxidoreductase [unclassified Nesterenkonia]MCH8561191.1 SDR family oxidoreductase [Nesterenkonia sp. DZ6]MCH8562507.1 SDR family oxidoreductase [Nesterenkonia sp. YGD6]MCH8571343.1 SDR family oxidoreductase [Nesterenkonia sp. AY15]
MIDTDASTRSALVTGASSGIGAATAHRLTTEGWRVFAVARRAEKLESLAEQEGIIPIICDVTDPEQVAAALEEVTAAGGIDTLINNAGGALGMDTVAEGRPEDWLWMYEVNVLGALNMIKAFVPMLRAHGEGTILTVTSTAALAPYEGGAGYNAAKFGEHALTGALRLEEAEHNIRVIEVLPGMVATEEFTAKRLRGDVAAAEAVYRGVKRPLVAEDIAEVIAAAVTLPHHVNLDQVVVRPVAQAAQHKVIREE